MTFKTSESQKATDYSVENQEVSHNLELVTEFCKIKRIRWVASKDRLLLTFLMQIGRENPDALANLEALAVRHTAAVGSLRITAESIMDRALVSSKYRESA